MTTPARGPMVASLLSALLFLVLASGCKFDARYQEDIRFPATLVIVNETGVSLTIDAIRSRPDADGTFVLNGDTLAPGAVLRRRVSSRAYQVLRDGAFFLNGTCGGRTPWEVAGQRLPRQGVQDGERWDLTVTITRCDP
ncbi:hypothetical protein [uncultured Lamprocystis sp.]|uniref:hypothetical protein n=1 Tax=uncultured Lamprocystis sp. TaxID=543132 RepID=UPI0025F7C0E8|nr:hypothetical protein [uncultured Lamprocystis sp.]